MTSTQNSKLITRNSLQHTLAAEFTQSGVGLHSGVATTVRVLPADVDQGRYFVRVDLPDKPIIKARVEAVSQTVLSTELSSGKACVRTVEHLLAALAGMGVDNARIEIDGAEVPLLDGSAQVWAYAIANAQLTAQNSPAFQNAGENLRPQSESPAAPQLPHSSSSFLPQPIWVYDGDAFVAAIPSPELSFTYGIDFDLPAIGNQWHSWTPAKESFVTAIAPARTFGLAHQIEQLRSSGLIKGGTLDSALVCGSEGWLNPPLRFANEPVRHKILDLVGDLSLLGKIPIAHFFAYKASHKLHTQLAQRILDSRF